MLTIALGSSSCDVQDASDSFFDLHQVKVVFYYTFNPSTLREEAEQSHKFKGKLAHMVSPNPDSNLSLKKKSDFSQDEIYAEPHPKF